MYMNFWGHLKTNRFKHLFIQEKSKTLNEECYLSIVASDFCDSIIHVELDVLLFKHLIKENV